MLQPEALSEASSLTVPPLLPSAGNHVNSGGRGEGGTQTQARHLSETCILEIVLSCVHRTTLSGSRLGRTLLRPIFFSFLLLSLPLCLSLSLSLSGCSTETA